MSPVELATLHRDLHAAAGPEDVFGVLDGTPDEQVRAGTTIYRRLARVAHEDRYPADPERSIAHEAFTKLNALWQLAQQRIHDKLYGSATPSTPAAVAAIKTKAHTYTIMSVLGAGDMSALYRAVSETGVEVLVKVASAPTVNGLLEREATVLTALHAAAEHIPTMSAYYPAIIETAVVKDASGRLSRVNVFAWQDGFVPLTTLVSNFPEGIDGRHVAWIGNRLWTALAFAHEEGHVHGAVLPTHVLVHPDTHGLLLVDWGYSVPTGQPIRNISGPYRPWYPPEVLGKLPATTETDVYMAALCLSYVAGGDVLNGVIPVKLPPLFYRFFSGCVLPNPARRPQAGWELFDRWQAIVKDVYGDRKFVKLALTHG